MNNVSELKEYLKEVKELQEAKLTYSSIIEELEEKDGRLGVHETYNDPRKGSVDYNCVTWLGTIVIELIILQIAGGIILFLLSFIFRIDFSELAEKNFPESILIPIVLVLVALITVVIPARDYRNRCKDNEADYRRRVNEVYELRKKDEERVNHELNVERPKLRKLIEFYSQKLHEIEAILNSVYDIGIIDKRYHNYPSAVMFYEYVDSGRCDDLKECMNKFDDDIQFAQIHYRIDLLNDKLDKMYNSLEGKFYNLKNTLNTNLRRVNNLITTSMNESNDRLNRLEYNEYIQNYYIQKYL